MDRNVNFDVIAYTIVDEHLIACETEREPTATTYYKEHSPQLLIKSLCDINMAFIVKTGYIHCVRSEITTTSKFHMLRDGAEVLQLSTGIYYLAIIFRQ